MLIVGGDAAGMSAAMQIVRSPMEADITVLEQGMYYSYAQCGLPYLIGGEVEKTEDLVARTQEQFREKYGIDARVEEKAVGLDSVHKQVTVRSREGRVWQESYDRLLVATGARARKPQWPGSDLGGVHVLKHIPDAERIKDELQQVKQVAVVGGGYVGLEMCEVLRHLGLEVHLIQRSGQLGANFDDDMADYIAVEAEKQGVHLHFHENVEALLGDKNVEAVQTDRKTIPAQMVIAAIGVEPNTDWIEGLEKDRHGALMVDAYLRTSNPDIYAAGDCAVQYHRIKEAFAYIPLGTTANKQGALAGMNMADIVKPFAGIVGTGVLRFFDQVLARTGIGEQEAAALGWDVGTITTESRSAAGYMPDAAPLQVKLIYDPSDNKLLGGQLIGAGADKRIDVLATALYNNMKVPDLLELDLSYAPPFNGVWDPIQQAAKRLWI